MSIFRLISFALMIALSTSAYSGFADSTALPCAPVEKSNPFKYFQIFLDYLKGNPSSEKAVADSDLVAAHLLGTPGSDLILSLSKDESLNKKLRSDKALWTQIKGTHFRGDSFNSAYHSKIAGGVDLQFLFSEPSGVEEGYTIGQHTSRVLDLYTRQRSFYNLDSIPKPLGVGDLDKLMLFTLTFHDIGKSIATRGGDKEQEILYSTPIAEHLMHDLNFTEAESKLTGALINTHQQIGTVIKAGSSADPELIARVADDINTNARAANMAPKDFFKLLELVFACDAGAYPVLTGEVFNVEINGKTDTKTTPDAGTPYKLVPKDEANFKKLADEIQ
jgi:hypothetical protein